MKYEKPELFTEEYIPDTMIASSLGAEPKDGNAGNNQNCWGCRNVAGELDPGDLSNACCYLPNTAAYTEFC